MINRQIGTPTIPTNIIVHLGAKDEDKKNIQVSFVDYIKNVSCSELYPTWPSEAIKANVLAIVSFTLSRIYNEWYYSQGYDFDITSSSLYDQTFVENRTLFDNINKIVDENFNNYLIKGEQIQPFFASYCDGKHSTCDGLLQFKSVELAKEGKNALEILRYFYGNNIYIIEDANVANNIATYPGVSLKLGDVSEHIRIIKRQLNRIAKNYPAIPKLTQIHEFFDILLEKTVKVFQDIFDLEVTGIIDKATWYKIKYLYTSVKKLTDIYSEGISKEEIELKYELEQKEGESGDQVKAIHYVLNVIGHFNSNIPLLDVDSIYDFNTTKMVKAFQKEYGLETTGTIDTTTWNKMKDVYLDIIHHLPPDALEYQDYIYPGRFLSLGMVGSDVESLQKILRELGHNEVEITGCYDTKTEIAIKDIQSILSLEQTGVAGPLEWEYIAKEVLNI